MSRRTILKCDRCPNEREVPNWDSQWNVLSHSRGVGGRQVAELCDDCVVQLIEFLGLRSEIQVYCSCGAELPPEVVVTSDQHYLIGPIPDDWRRREEDPRGGGTPWQHYCEDPDNPDPNYRPAQWRGTGGKQVGT